MWFRPSRLITLLASIVGQSCKLFPTRRPRQTTLKHGDKPETCPRLGSENKIEYSQQLQETMKSFA